MDSSPTSNLLCVIHCGSNRQQFSPDVATQLDWFARLWTTAPQASIDLGPWGPLTSVFPRNWLLHLSVSKGSMIMHITYLYKPGKSVPITQHTAKVAAFMLSGCARAKVPACSDRIRSRELPRRQWESTRCSEADQFYRCNNTMEGRRS